MQPHPIPILKDLVLVGGGHSHITVLKRFGMQPLPGVRLTLIARDVHTPYSGMLPGLIAGHYGFDDAHIDLGPLVRFAGARLIHDEATGIDLPARKVLCRAHPPVSYDLLSLNVGSTPALGQARVAAGRVVPVKPINNFLSRWEAFSARVLAGNGTVRIGIVGGGAGGVELALSAAHGLRRAAAAVGKPAGALVFELFSATEDLLPTHNRGARARLARVLEEKNILVHRQALVVEVADGRALCADGREFPVDEVLWATQAAAAPWLRESGLAVDENGFVQVHPTLQSVSHPEVFAAGDVSSVVGQPREKSGVFAVRQGPPLARNLRRALQGQEPKPFRLQQKFLSLISTGDRRAVASRGGWSVGGRLVWRLKDWIDRRFMRRFNVLPEMRAGSGPAIASGLASPELLREISTAAMRCGGCGAKLGATVLDRVLSRLEPVRRDDILLGLDAPDDAAAASVPPGKVMVHTVDFLRPLVDDPYLFGKIVATHALSDIFAMGAEPQSALAIAVLPFGPEAKVEEMLEHLMTGVLEVLKAARTALAGGHTSEGPELGLGLAVNGLACPDRLLRKGGMKPGDQLLLTKALGTGTLFAAEMRRQARGRWISGAVASMLQSNEAGASCLRRHGATACTDVTGFGLLGHLVEMSRASGVEVEVVLAAVPILDGALETAAAGLLSSLQPENVRLRRAVRGVESAARHPCYPLLFDPQTSGGLLASVPAAGAAACLAELRALGYERAAIVGSVAERSAAPEPIRLQVNPL